MNHMERTRLRKCSHQHVMNLCNTLLYHVYPNLNQKTVKVPYSGATSLVRRGKLGSDDVVRN